MNFKFDYYHNLEDVNFYLHNPDGKELFPLYPENRNFNLRFKDISELSFDTYLTMTSADGTTLNRPEYDYIQTKRLVLVEDIGWFQIQSVVEHDDGLTKYKTVSCESYQTVLKNKGVFTEERVYCFYNPLDPIDSNYDPDNPSSIPSIVGQLHQQLGIGAISTLGSTDKPPNLAEPFEDWTITYVHSDLVFHEATETEAAHGACRTLTKNTTYGYDWITNDVSQAFEVLVIFDYLNKSIQFCKVNERWLNNDPKVLYSFNNFMKHIDVTENADDIVTVLNCNGNNCNILAVNPTGTNYICDFSYYMDATNKRWMSDELIAALTAWQTLCKNSTADYQEIFSESTEQYKIKTELETELSTISTILQDLKNAQAQRGVLGDGTAKALCGKVMVETVLVGNKSMSADSGYNTSAFTGGSKIAACWTAAPTDFDTNDVKYKEPDTATKIENKTADEIIQSNLTSGTEGETGYWYFTDDNWKTYCKLESKAEISYGADGNIEYESDGKPKVVYSCKGFKRFIPFLFPTIDENGNTEYIDELQTWINNYEAKVSEINQLLNGTALEREFKVTLSGGKSLTLTSEPPSNCKFIKSAFARCDSKLAKPTVIYSNSETPKLTVSLSGTGTHEITVSYYYYTEYPLKAVNAEISRLEAELQSISDQCNILNYFAQYDTEHTTSLLKELGAYWIEGDYTNENITVLESTTQAEALDLAQQLLESGQTELAKVCQPRLSFTLNSADVIRQHEFKDQMNALELGQRIAIEKEDGVWYQPRLLEMSFNLDNRDAFKLSFANSFTLNTDWGYTYADLISDASSTSRQVHANWQNLTSYSKERENIASIIESPLDATLRASTANAVNQEFVVDHNGILGRKKTADGSFEKEQVRMSNNTLIFTDDNWTTAKAALGKVTLPDGTIGYGLVAEHIIGKMIMGDNLSIGNKNGTVSINQNGIVITNGATEVFKATKDGTLIINSTKTPNSFSYILNSSQFVIKSRNIEVLNVDTNGLTLYGSIYAESGHIANWDICEDYLGDQDTGFYGAKESIPYAIDGSCVKFYAGVGQVAKQTTDVQCICCPGSLVTDMVRGICYMPAYYPYDPTGVDYQVTKEQLTKIVFNGSTISYGSIFSETQFLRNDRRTLEFRGQLTDAYKGKVSASKPITLTFTLPKYTANFIITSTGALAVQRILSTPELYGGCTARNVHPIDLSCNIGTSSTRWNYVYANTINYTKLTEGSDIRLKHSVGDLCEKYNVLFDNLRSKSYIYNADNENKIRLGFIAQDVIKAMTDSGLDCKNSAIITRDDNDMYGLCYIEFIPLLVDQVQKLKQRIKSLEDLLITGE